MHNPRGIAAWVLATGLIGVPAANVGAQEAADAITVAPDGNGDHASIPEAIAAAEPGSIILLSPGTYEEGFLVDKAVTLRGDGPREEIIIAPAAGTEVTHEAPWGEIIPIGVYVDQADVTFEHLTLTFDDDYLGLLLDGGASTLEDVSVTGSEIVMPRGEPTFRDSRIESYFAVRGASPTVEDSELLGHASVDGPGRTVIRRSTLRAGTSASADAVGAYEDNLFIGQQLAVDSGSDMVVRGNTVRDVSDNQAGILVVGDGSSAEIMGNTVEGAAIGISVDSSEPVSSIVGNIIRDVRVGIHVESDAPTRIEDNDISGAQAFGILLQRGAPVVAGNRICDTEQAFELRGGAEPLLGTNEICEAEEAGT